MRFLHRPEFGIVLLATALLPAGCGQNPTTSQPAGSQFSLKKAITRQAVPNDLRQIALSYQGYIDTFHKPPAKLEDLKADLQGAGKLYQAIEDGYYVVVWKVRQPSSNTILAYEKDADSDGMRFVVTGDNAVKKLNEQDFQAALASR